MKPDVSRQSAPSAAAGSDKKHAAFRSRFEGVESLGSGSTAADGAQLASSSGRAEMQTAPWLLKTGLKPEQAATQDENWCGVLQVRVFRFVQEWSDGGLPCRGMTMNTCNHLDDGQCIHVAA